MLQQSSLPAATCPDVAATASAVPPYMAEVYDWAYVNPRWVRWLDRNSVVRTLLFGNDQRLMRAYLKLIQPGMRVWQLAHVYGDLVRRAAQACGPSGQFFLTDVTPIQLDQAAGKLADLPWAHLRLTDAAYFRCPTDCNLICSFFLLHEVPDRWKRAIVDNVLAQLPAGGTALFVDYHRPARWQPVRYILQWVNRKLEPFAEALWHNEIRSYASKADRFSWHKRTIFGGVYQIVEVRHIAK